jgi:hypothetical protein
MVTDAAKERLAQKRSGAAGFPQFRGFRAVLSEASPNGVMSTSNLGWPSWAFAMQRFPQFKVTILPQLPEIA